MFWRTKCWGKTKKGNQCSRQPLHAYCHQHRPWYFWISTVLIYFITSTYGLLVIANEMGTFVETGYKPVNKFLAWLDMDELGVDECNPNGTRGCKFDMYSSLNHHQTKKETSLSSDKTHYHTKYRTSINTIIVNDHQVEGYSPQSIKKFGREKLFFPFPSEYSPYEVSYWDGKILLRGILHDFKFEKKLGWFSEDKFKIHQFETGGCAFTHCIDDYGIEIYNLDYEVVFSFSKTYSDGYRFSGSYENNKRYFVSDGEVEQMFWDKESAIEFRENSIPYLFDYSDNCKRLIFEKL